MAEIKSQPRVVRRTNNFIATIFEDKILICFVSYPQGAAVVLTPAYCDTQITSPVPVNVVVMFGNGRDAKSSDPIEFTYKPKPNVKVQEVEMHPSLPVATDNFLQVDFINPIGDVVMNNIPHELLQPPTPAPEPPQPATVVLPVLSDEQGNKKRQHYCLGACFSLQGPGFEG